MRDAAFLAFLLGIFPLCLLTPAVPILVWAWCAMLAPNEVLYGFTSSIPYQKLFAVLAIISILMSTRKRRFHLDLSTSMMLLLLLLGTVSQAITPFPSDYGWTLQDGLMKVVTLSLVISWAMADRVRIHSLVNVVCIGLAFAIATEGLMFFATGGSHIVIPIPSYGDNNLFGLLADMAIPLLIYASRQNANRMLRLAYLALCVLAVAAAISTRSRGAFVGLGVLAISFSLLSRRKIASLLAVAVLAVCFAAVVPQTWTKRMDTIDKAGQDESFLGRVIAWKISTLIALDRPLVGGGFNAIVVPSAYYHYLPEFNRLSFIPTPLPTGIRVAHSIYFEVLGDTGFAGLAIFLLMIGGAFLNMRRIRRATRGHPELEWAGSLVRATQLSFLVFLVSGAVLNFAFHEIVYVIIGLISATRQCVLQTVPVSVPARRRRLPVRGAVLGGSPALRSPGSAPLS